MATNSAGVSNRCELVTNFAALIVAVFVLNFLILVLLPWRLLVWTLAKLLRSDLTEFVTGLSAFLVNLDTLQAPTASVAGFFILDGQVPVEEFQRLTEQRIFNKDNKARLYSRLKQGYVNFMGYAFRKREDNFRIEEHVRVFDYDDLWPSGTEVHEAHLQDILGGLLSKQYVMSRSPWELLLLYDFKEENSTQLKMILCFRFHHSLADGYSLTQFFEDLFQSEIPLPAITGQSGQRAVPLCKRILMPFVSLYQFAKVDIETRVEDHDWQVKVPTREYGVTISRAIPVQKVKEIKNYYGASYLSVLLTSVSVAFARVMQESGQKIPSKFKCCLPLVKPDHPDAMTNHAFLQVLTLDTAVKMEPELLTSVDRALRDTRLASVGSDIFVTLIGQLPKCLFPHMNADVTFGASVFPVPTKTCYFQGLKISGAMHSIGTFNAGALVAISGFDGTQRVTFSADKSIVPSQLAFRNLSNYVNQEIENLYKLMDSPKNGDNEQVNPCVINMD